MRGGRAMRTSMLGLALLAAACADPYTAPGTWRPSDTNERNLRAMVADPRHLEEGVGAPASDGHLSAAAVARLRTDRVRPLPASGIAKIDATGAGPGGVNGAR